eukprot:1934620-Pyramimonas_sp.AAC.3
MPTEIKNNLFLVMHCSSACTIDPRPNGWRENVRSRDVQALSMHFSPPPPAPRNVLSAPIARGRTGMEKRGGRTRSTC